MPIQYVPAEEFMHVDLPAGRVRVYHVYKNDDPENNPPRDLWFSLTPYGSDSSGRERGCFSVDELPGLPEHWSTTSEDDRVERITYAIKSGYFDDWDDFEPQPISAARARFEDRFQSEPRQAAVDGFRQLLDEWIAANGITHAAEILGAWLTDGVGFPRTAEELAEELQTMGHFEEN